MLDHYFMETAYLKYIKKIITVKKKYHTDSSPFTQYRSQKASLKSRLKYIHQIEAGGEASEGLHHKTPLTLQAPFTLIQTDHMILK